MPPRKLAPLSDLADNGADREEKEETEVVPLAELKPKKKSKKKSMDVEGAEGEVAEISKADAIETSKENIKPKKKKKKKGQSKEEGESTNAEGTEIQELKPMKTKKKKKPAEIEEVDSAAEALGKEEKEGEEGEEGEETEEGKEASQSKAAFDDKKSLNKSSFFGSLFGAKKPDQKPSTTADDMEQGGVPPDDDPDEDEDEDPNVDEPASPVEDREPEHRPQVALTTVMPVRRSAGFLDTVRPAEEAAAYTQFAPSAAELHSVVVCCGGTAEDPGVDNGTYKEPRPFVQPCSLQRMEKRLHHEEPSNRKVWFDRDDQMQVLGKPVKSDLSRPIHRLDLGAPCLQMVTVAPTAGQAIQDKVYRLDIELTKLELHVHPLQSEEDMLAARLIAAFREYKRGEFRGTRDFYAEKLHALQKSLLATSQRIKLGFGPGHNNPEREAAEERLAALKVEVEQLRQLRDEEEERIMHSTEYMRELYANIETVRKANQFRSTEVHLQFQREATDEALQTEREDVEVSVMLIEKEQSHVQRHLESIGQYQVKARKLENELQRLLDSRKDPTKSSKKERAAREALEQLEEPSPNPPRFDAERERAEIFARLRKEKKGKVRNVAPVLTVNPSSHEQPNAAEDARRKKLMRTRFATKLCVNGQKVGSTQERTLGMDFTSDFPHVFSLQLRQWPEDVRLQVVEKGVLHDGVLAEIFLTVPGLDRNKYSDPSPIGYHFNSQTPFQPHWVSAIKLAAKKKGKGEPETSVTPAPEVMFTAGMVYAQCAWKPLNSSKAGDEGTVIGNPLLELEASPFLAPPVPPHLHSAASKHSVPAGMAGYVSKFKQAQYMKEAKVQVDPNDPRNVALMDVLRTGETTERSGTRFRLEMDDDLQLSTHKGDAYMESKRSRMMKERWENNVKLDTPVPLLDADVDDRLLEKASRLKHASLAMKIGGVSKISTFPMLEDAMTREQAHTYSERFHSFYRQVQQSMEKTQRAAGGTFGGRNAKLLKLHDVVTDTPLPTFRLDLSFIVQLFQPNRKLRPRRKKPKMLAAPSQCDVLVTVQKAFNLPERKDIGGDEYARGGALHPLVEVTFQGKRKVSSTSEGTNPLWNQQMVLPFVPHNNDFSPESLVTNPDYIVITLFDEVMVSGEFEGRGRSDEEDDRKLRTLHRYIGSLRVPVSSVYRAQIVQGVFELKVPPVLLGYTLPTAAPLLSVYIVLKPNISIPKSFSNESSQGEDDALMRYAQKWQSDVLNIKHCKSRAVRAIVTNTAGSGVFLPRYIFPLAPHADLMGDGAKKASEVTLRRILRFVSLIPATQDWITFRRRQDVWPTCRDMLEICNGDHEEHALLLCNYFLYMGLQAYVVLGPCSYSPRGALVLTTGPEGGGATEDDGTARLWCACTGAVHSVRDMRVEMCSVGMVFNDQNVWANVQSKSEPWELSWDLQNSRLWRPFFCASFPSRPIGSVQLMVDYRSDSGANSLYSEIQSKLEGELKSIIMYYRQQKPYYAETKFNNQVRNSLRTLLKDIEETHQHRTKPSNSSSNSEGDAPAPRQRGDRGRPAMEDLSSLHTDALSHHTNYQIFGFPFHMMSNETSSKDLEDLVLGTQLAKDFSVGVEFAVATHVVNYGVDYVCSIWVYLAVLKKIR